MIIPMYVALFSNFSAILLPRWIPRNVKIRLVMANIRLGVITFFVVRDRAIPT